MGCGSYNVVRSRPPTPQEQAQIDEEVRRFEVRQKEARGAEERALVLLDARLGPTEARLFKRTHTLMRPSQLWSGVEYLIPDGGHEMVKVVNRGEEQTRLCVISAAGEPWPDRTMTILDLIESGQERRLWEMANVFPTQARSAAEPLMRFPVPPPSPSQMGWGLLAAISTVAFLIGLVAAALWVVGTP